MRMQVARSAEAQPEETDPAKASSENLRLHGQNHPSSQDLTSRTLFVPVEVNRRLDESSFNRGDEK